MAFDAFIKLKGLNGPVVRKGLEKSIELYSFSFGASNPVSVNAHGGMGAGKVSISSFNLMKKSDATSPELFQACCTGHHYDEAVVQLFKAGGTQQKFIEYKFEDVMVESIQWSGSSGGDDTPTESLSFAFQKVEIMYQQQDDKGNVGKPVIGKWDMAQASAS
jgi:type VI secretion system secreted protein Hcp